MKIEENLDLFNRLKNEFKNRYGTEEVRVPYTPIVEVTSERNKYLTTLRINPLTDEFEWYKEGDYFEEYGWFPQDGEDWGFHKVWFEALCQVLDCKQRTTYYLPSGEKIYSTEIKDCNEK